MLKLGSPSPGLKCKSPSQCYFTLLILQHITINSGSKHWAGDGYWEVTQLVMKIKEIERNLFQMRAALMK